MILFCSRNYRVLAVGILALAAFNIGFRLNSEVVAEWDESLYGISAWEMTQSGNWVATTREGVLDYYNTKPPLNVWLIALAFKGFGVSLWSLRLASALSAWLTIVVLQGWTRRYFGPAVALLSSLVLTTSYAFLYVHSGKSADTDALFTLLILLTVVVLCAGERRRWMLVWLGPVAATTFMLRGMAVLMPMALIAIVELFREGPRRGRVPPLAVAAVACAAPIAAWTLARWQIDGGRFLQQLFFFDFVARTAEPLDEHGGGPLYYLDILQRHHYDWLVAAAASLALFPAPLARLRSTWLTCWREHRALCVLISAWVVTTVTVPTLMATKVPWYLNPFYPIFAVGVGALVIRGLSREGHNGRRRVLAAVLAAVVLVAEGRLIWTSYYRRDPSRSVQGLLLEERARIRGERVYRDRWNNAEIFVLDALIGAKRGITKDVMHFLRESCPGDYFISEPDVSGAELTLVRRDRRGSLYRRKS